MLRRLRRCLALWFHLKSCFCCCCREGIHVDLGFFKDILIPHSSMYRACSWDADERVRCEG